MKALVGNGGMTTKSDVRAKKANEILNLAQSLPGWAGALAPASYAALACQRPFTPPPEAAWTEKTAAIPDAAATAPRTNLWIALESRRDAAWEVLAVAVLGLVAAVAVVQAIGGVNELALGIMQAGAWASRLAG
jgi:hypothetical protein